MVAFVLYAHHQTVRPGLIQCSGRSRWTGQRSISHGTSQIYGHPILARTAQSRNRQRHCAVPKAMFSGGGGFLGVGPSEIIVILGVGWLLLGPEKLFSLAKDSGKLLGELRRTADEAKDSLNDAMELDAIAAEFEKGQRAEQKNGLPKSGSDDRLANGLEKLSSGTEEITSTDAPPEGAAVDSEAAVSTAFLEQLQRVADPNQKAPSDELERLPDLDSYPDEELEVQRLQKQYFEARKRLEERRRHETESTASESEPIAEER